jgi:hypothetical protein
MPLFYCAIALAAVTVIYLFWRSYLAVLLQRRRVLRERVTHMLWVMADPEDSPQPRNPKREFDSSPDMA